MRKTIPAVLLLAAGCGRVATGPGPSPYAWEVVKPGACRAVSFGLAEGRGAAVVPMSGASGPPPEPPLTLAFRLALPSAVRTGDKPLHAYLLRQDGTELPLSVAATAPDGRAVEVEVLAEHPKWQQTADIKVVLPNGDTSVYRLHLPPRDLPDAPESGPDSLNAKGVSIVGEAWCEPPRAAGQLPVAAAVLSVKGLSMHGTAWTIASQAIYLPDRQAESRLVRDRALVGITPAGTWTIGRAWTGTWAADPKVVRMAGVLTRWNAFTERIDLGDVPVRVLRLLGDDQYNPFTLVQTKMEVRTPSGLQLTLAPSSVGTLDAVETVEGTTNLVLNVLVQQPLTTGIPASLRDPGREILELRNVAPGVQDIFHQVQFNLEGQAVVFVGAKKPGQAKQLHVVLELRRRAPVEQTPFDLCVPVRQGVRTSLSAHQEPNPTGRILVSSFDPAAVGRPTSSAGTR